ncbi:MAG: DNA ligase [Subdoligranulum variabile]|nr:MAG: DNA ligase [Subdoligranulum variabile]
MSKMSELDICIGELRTAANALSSVADTLQRFFSTSTNEAETPAPITKEQVRSVLSQKSTAGHGAAVRALLKDFGASQLSDVDPAQYADLINAAAAIGTEVRQDG